MEESLQPDIALARKTKRLRHYCMLCVALAIIVVIVTRELQIPNFLIHLVTILSIVPVGMLIMALLSSREQYWAPLHKALEGITAGVIEPLEKAKTILYQEAPTRGEQLVALIYLGDICKFMEQEEEAVFADVRLELNTELSLESIRDHHSAIVCLSRPIIKRVAVTRQRFQDAWKSA